MSNSGVRPTFSACASRGYGVGVALLLPLLLTLLLLLLTLFTWRSYSCSTLLLGKDPAFGSDQRVR